MVMTAREQLSLLRVQNAALQAKNDALEERIKVLEKRFEPKPAPRVPPPPAWAGSGDPNMTGMNAPAPSVSQQRAAGTAGITVDAKTGHRKFPDGLLRDDSGQVVPHSIARTVERRPVGPERNWQHDQAVRTLDAMIERDAALDRQR
jgi:hypothetical protein